MLSPTDAEVLVALERIGRTTAENLAKIAGKSRSRVSSVLNEMARQGIVRKSVEGKKVYYGIDPREYAEVKRDIETRPLLELAEATPAHLDKRVRRIFFDFREDAESMYRYNMFCGALDALYAGKRKQALQDLIKSVTYAVITDIWPVRDGLYTNFDFDLQPLRAEPLFLETAAEVMLAEGAERLKGCDGIIAIRSKKEEAKSFASGTSTKDSVPLGVALSMRSGLPLVVYEDGFEKLAKGRYAMVDDVSVTGEIIERVIRDAEAKGGSVTAVLSLLRRGPRAEAAAKARGAAFHYLFDLAQLVQLIFPHGVYTTIGRR